MGRPVLTDAQVQAFRERATDVAMRLFVHDGYEGFSLRALAKELGCSHATPYRYFDGKPELFAAVRAEGFRRFAAHLRDHLHGKRAPLSRVRALADAYFGFANEQPEAFSIIFEMRQESDEFPFVDEAGAAAWGVLYEVIEGAIEAGALIGDPNTVAHTMWAAIHGVATLHVAGKLRMGRQGEDIVVHMTDALIGAHAATTKKKKKRSEKTT